MHFAYLVTLAADYQQAGTFAEVDLNGDGSVDFKELVILAANYGHAFGASTALRAATRRGDVPFSGGKFPRRRPR